MLKTSSLKIDVESKAIEGPSLESLNVGCPECKSTRFIRDYDRAEMTCQDCGLVLRDKIMDVGPEWRAFDLEQYDKKTRIGAPLTFTIHDRGLSTVIDRTNKDASGRGFTLVKRLHVYKLRRWQQRTRVLNSYERNLAYALSELERMASQMGLSRNIKEEAALIYRRAVESRLIRGRSIESVVAAALYMACRQAKLPRTLDEIATVSNIEKKEVSRRYRLLLRSLSAKVSPTSFVSYVPKLISKLNLPNEVLTESIAILNKASEAGLTSGRGPMGIVAAAIYIASALLQYKCTQKELAASANVTEVTVRNRYQELLKKLDLIVSI